MPNATATVATKSARTRSHSYSYASDLASITLDEGRDGAHRSWVMLLPQGQYEHPKGQLNLTPQMLREVKRNFDGGVRGVEIALDYDHKASEGDSRAFGWIERVELCERGQTPDGKPRSGGDLPAGLWGLIRWTRLGLADVKDEIYRYVSAEFKPEWTNPVNGRCYHNVLIGAALTNRPFMNHMPAITLSSKESMGVAGKNAKKPTAPVVEPEEEEDDTELDDMGDEGGGSSEMYDEADGGGGEDDGEPDEDADDEEPQPKPTPTPRRGVKKARSAKKMSERDGGDRDGESVVSLREQLDAQAVKLREAEMKLAEAEVERTIKAWETGSVKPSKALADEYRTVMLSETVRGDEELAGQIRRLAEAAFKGAVDLSVRSGGTDMELRRDRKLGEGADGDEVAELANKYALSEHQRSIDALANSSKRDERQAAQELIKRAAKELDFKLVAH